MPDLTPPTALPLILPHLLRWPGLSAYIGPLQTVGGHEILDGRGLAQVATPAATQLFGRVFKREKCRFISQRRSVLIANRLDRIFCN